MIDQLETIAVSLGLAFTYGTLSELNVLADAHPAGVLLYHEGYHTADLAILGNGSLQYSYSLSLVLFTPSLLSDSITDTRGNIALLRPLSRSLLLQLNRIGTIANARESGNLLLNRTDRTLDGLRLSLTLTTEGQSTC